MSSGGPVCVLICGGGNGAHVMAGIAASQPNTESRVLTLYADEAERWTKAMKDGYAVEVLDKGVQIAELTTKPSIVTKDPAAAAPGCDIITLVVPAFAHALYLEQLKPYIKPGTIIVGLPGQAGFEFAIRGILGEIAKECTVMNFESLPWACRIQEFGKKAEALGTKLELSGAVHLGVTPSPRDPKAMLQQTLGEHPVLQTEGHVLGMTLMGVNAFIHPSILYGQWYNWDGVPKDEPPLFYHGVDDFTADFLTEVSNEVVGTAQAIMKKYPNVNLHNVSPVYDWYIKCYHENITDTTNLKTALTTNQAYIGLTHPTKKTDDGKYVPNFGYRYITEDIPFGLVVLRGIAEITGVKTPYMDKIIKWAEKITDKEYLVDGSVKGKDVKSTRTAQRYGLESLDAILGLEEK